MHESPSSSLDHDVSAIRHMGGMESGFCPIISSMIWVFSGGQVGLIYSLLPLATIVAPFIGGQIADRYFPDSVCNFCSSVYWAAFCSLSYHELRDYSAMMWLMLLYCFPLRPNTGADKLDCLHQPQESG